MSRVSIAVIVMAATVTTCAAGWDGFPVTNATWDAARTNQGQVRQLWEAGKERWAVLDSSRKLTQSGPGEITVAVTAFGGESSYVTNIVTTNGVGSVTTNTYTNRIFGTVSLSITNRISTIARISGTQQQFSAIQTQYQSTVTYQTTNNGTAATYTASVPLTMEFIDRSVYEFFGADYSDEVGDYQEPGAAYLATNFASGGTFDGWWTNTGSGTEPPTYWPKMSGPQVCHDLDVGWYSNIYGTTIGSNDARGYVRGSLDSYDAYTWGLDVDIPNPFSRILTESVALTNGVWTNRFASSTYYVWSNEFPTLTYYTTGSVPAGSVSVTGQVFEAPVFPDYSWGLSYGPETTISITGTNTAVPIMYANASITAINATNLQGDSIQLRYTNNRAFPHTSEGSTQPYQTVLDAEDFNQRWKILDAMRWTLATVSWTNPPDGNPNYYVWTGVATNNGVITETWDDAKTRCAASTPVATTNISASAFQKTEGTFTGITNNYALTATAYSLKSVPRIHAWTNNVFVTSHVVYAHSGQVYFAPTNSAGQVYDAQDSGLTEPGRIKLHDTVPAGLWAYGTNVAVGVTTFPPNWCAEPTDTNRATSLGYVIGSEAGVIKWDVTGGFEYK